MAFGGWEESPDKRCAIITTEANSIMKPIHHRMPLIFLPEEKATWLSDDIPLSKLINNLEPADSKELEAYEVSHLAASPSAANKAPVSK